MYIKNIKLNGDWFDDITRTLIEENEPKNITNFFGGIQIAYENNPFLNQDCGLLVVLIIKHSDSTNISLMSGGNGIDLLSAFGLTTDKGTVKNYFSDIEMFCKSNEITYEILDEELIT